MNVQLLRTLLAAPNCRVEQRPGEAAAALLERAQELACEDAVAILPVLGALVEVVRLRATVDQDVPGVGGGRGSQRSVQEDRLLTADEAARRLGMSKRWLYAKAGSLPFTRRVSARAVRFSERELERWQATGKD